MSDEDRQKNITSAYSLSQRALWMSQQKLKREGIHYPLYNNELTPQQNAEALDEYKRAELAFYTYYLKHPSGARPIEEFPPREDWSIKAYG